MSEPDLRDAGAVIETLQAAARHGRIDAQDR